MASVRLHGTSPWHLPAVFLPPASSIPEFGALRKPTSPAVMGRSGDHDSTQSAERPQRLPERDNVRKSLPRLPRQRAMNDVRQLLRNVRASLDSHRLFLQDAFEE